MLFSKGNVINHYEYIDSAIIQNLFIDSKAIELHNCILQTM